MTYRPSVSACEQRLSCSFFSSPAAAVPGTGRTRRAQDVVVGGRGAAQEALPAICPGSGAGARRGLTPPGHRALLVLCVLEH